MAYKISLVDSLGVFGHSRLHNSLGTPMLDIADDEDVIGQMVGCYNGWRPSWMSPV